MQHIYFTPEPEDGFGLPDKPSKPPEPNTPKPNVHLNLKALCTPKPPLPIRVLREIGVAALAASVCRRQLLADGFPDNEDTRELVHAFAEQAVRSHRREVAAEDAAPLN